MSNNWRQAMPNKKIGTAEPHSIEEAAWRNVWLKSVLIDRGKPCPTSGQTDDTNEAMSALQRVWPFENLRAGRCGSPDGHSSAPPIAPNSPHTKSAESEQRELT